MRLLAGQSHYKDFWVTQQEIALRILAMSNAKAATGKTGNGTSSMRRHVLLFDGHCKLCRGGAGKLLRLARPGSIDLVSFQEPGALTPFPGITHEACMKQMFLIAPNGKAYAGVEAAVQALRTRRVLGFLVQIYYLPGIRFLCDRLYRIIADNRYRFGKISSSEPCTDGKCALHARASNR